MMSSILARLPAKAKSLARFNPIAKIHSYPFSQTPKKPSVHSHFLTCPVLGFDPAKKIPVKCLGQQSEIFMESCNGLVCMARPVLTDQVVLWNPATNFWKYLPHSGADLGPSHFASLGFGCSSDDEDFKMVRIFSSFDKDMKVEGEVYSSLSNCWETIDIGMKFQMIYPRSVVNVRGNPYWLAGFIYDDMERLALVGFDATKTALDKIVPLPSFDDIMKDPNCMVKFVEWEGYLAVILWEIKDGTYDYLEWINVWVFDDVEKKWSRNGRLGPVDLEVECCLGCSKDGRIIGACPNHKIFVYDSRRGNVAVTEFKKPIDCSLQIYPYEESSAFIEGMVPAEANKKENFARFNEVDGFFVASVNHVTGEVGCYYASGSSGDCPSLRVDIDGMV